MRAPAFIIGAQRCGTTRLVRSLDAHPEITCARPVNPEPKYFLRDDAIVGDPAGWVQSCFGSFASIRGLVPIEKSTSYIESDRAAERIAATFDHVTVVVILRDPVDRAVSNYAFSVANGLEDRGPREALLGATPEWDTQHLSVNPYDYIGRSKYDKHLTRWWRFGEQLHVLIFEEFVASPSPLKLIYKALGVNPDRLPEDWGEAVNATCAIPQIDAVTRSELAARLAPSVRRLEAQLGRRLGAWSSSSG